MTPATPGTRVVAGSGNQYQVATGWPAAPLSNDEALLHRQKQAARGAFTSYPSYSRSDSPPREYRVVRHPSPPPAAVFTYVSPATPAPKRHYLPGHHIPGHHVPGHYIPPRPRNPAQRLSLTFLFVICIIAFFIIGANASNPRPLR